LGGSRNAIRYAKANGILPELSINFPVIVLLPPVGIQPTHPPWGLLRQKIFPLREDRTEDKIEDNIKDCKDSKNQDPGSGKLNGCI
jgi:hypothetical protein